MVCSVDSLCHYGDGKCAIEMTNTAIVKHKRGQMLPQRYGLQSYCSMNNSLFLILDRLKGKQVWILWYNPPFTYLNYTGNILPLLFGNSDCCMKDSASSQTRRTVTVLQEKKSSLSGEVFVFELKQVFNWLTFMKFCMKVTPLEVISMPYFLPYNSNKCGHVNFSGRSNTIWVMVHGFLDNKYSHYGIFIETVQPGKWLQTFRIIFRSNDNHLEDGTTHKIIMWMFTAVTNGNLKQTFNTFLYTAFSITLFGKMC
jgi:hypothetical protein